MAVRIPSRKRLEKYGYVERGPDSLTPACPVLVDPAGGALITVTAYRMQWGAVDGATSYNLSVWVAGDAEPQPINVTTTFYDVALEYDTQYRWRVTAVNDFGESSGCTYGGSFSLQSGQSGYKSFETAEAFIRLTDDFHVSNGATTITLYAERLGSKAASSDYDTANGTASAGTDYVAVSGTVSWTEGETANQPIVVTLTPQTITEYAADFMPDWVSGFREPRDDEFTYQYKFIKQAANSDNGPVSPQWRDTLDEAFDDFAAFTGFDADQATVLMGWSYGSTSDDFSWELRPHTGDAPDQDREVLNLHFNDFEPSSGIFPYIADPKGVQDNARHCRAVASIIGIDSGQTIWYSGKTQFSVDSSGGAFKGIYYRSSSSSQALAFSPRGRNIANCFAVPGEVGNLYAIPDVIIQVRRVPAAPPLPGAEFDDWEVDPDDYTYDSATNTIYSKAQWVEVEGNFKWLSIYDVTATNPTIIRRPLSPVRITGSSDDTEANWTSDYDDAVDASDLPSGMHFDAQGNGAYDSYPRLSSTAWARTYVPPKSFAVALNNPVDAQLAEPTEATIWITE